MTIELDQRDDLANKTFNNLVLYRWSRQSMLQLPEDIISIIQLFCKIITEWKKMTDDRNLIIPGYLHALDIRIAKGFYNILNSNMTCSFNKLCYV